MSKTDAAQSGSCAQDDCYRDMVDEEHCYWHRKEHAKEPLNDDSPVRVIPDNLDDASLKNADLTNADLSDVSLRNADLSDAILSDAVLTNADLTDADLTDAILTDADLTNAILTDAELNDTDLTDADLTDAIFTDASLRNADLTDTIFTDASLWDADLTDASLWHANLIDASLRNANLTAANFQSADLADANLQNVDFIDADLQDANFTGVNLGGANLTGADLRNSDIKGSTVNGETKFGSRLPGWSSNMTAHARAYHGLRVEISREGYDRLARDLYVLEQKARTRAAFPRGPITFFGGLLSGLLTGYGVRPRRVFLSTTFLIALTTLWFNLAGVVYEGWNTTYELLGFQLRTGSLHYSVVTFVTSPPHPPQSTDLLTNLFVTVETYLGTVLTLLLGYTLSNRSRV